MSLSRMIWSESDTERQPPMTNRGTIVLSATSLQDLQAILARIKECDEDQSTERTEFSPFRVWSRSQEECSKSGRHVSLIVCCGSMVHYRQV